LALLFLPLRDKYAKDYPRELDSVELDLLVLGAVPLVYKDRCELVRELNLLGGIFTWFCCTTSICDPLLNTGVFITRSLLTPLGERTSYKGLIWETLRSSGISKLRSLETPERLSEARGRLRGTKKFPLVGLPPRVAVSTLELEVSCVCEGVIGV